MQRSFLSLSTAVILLSASLPIAAQKFQPKTIQFIGAPEYSDQELLAAAGLKKGDILNYADMSEHTKRLMDSGVFETLSFKFDGVDLIFTMKPAEVLYNVRLVNLPLESGKELEAKLHDRFPLFHGKVPGEGGLMEQVRQALEEMLAAQGIRTTVTAVPIAALGQRKASAIGYSIVAPAVRVGMLHIEGVSPQLQDKAKMVADVTRKVDFDTENTPGNIERAFAMLYADEGYAAAKIHVTRSGDPVVGSEAIEIPYSVVTEEGRLYKLGSIHLPPGALLTQAEIDKAAILSANSTAKGTTLHTTWSFIARRYKSKGYLDCIVTPHPEFDETSGIVNYSVQIDPGPVYHLALVKFDNVSDELRSRLMHLWQMLPGDPFDESYVSNFIVIAQKEDPILERSLAGVKTSYDVLADPQTREVNCVIRLEKKN